MTLKYAGGTLKFVPLYKEH